jgi:protein involved in polysaccharide export with SLBB domain
MILVEIVTDRTLGYTTMLDDEGYIVIPVIGRIQVAGLTLSETRDLLQSHVDQYYNLAWVSCRLQQMGKVKFYVYGDVRQPGFYTAATATTFFDFLQTFGLVSGADHRRIVHVQSQIGTTLPEPRDLISADYQPANQLIDEALQLLETGDIEEIDPRVTVVDPLTFTLEGQIEQRNFYLKYGDIIYVPDPKVLIQMTGFTRSGDVEVLPGENWIDLLRIAGPPTLDTNISNVVLERRDSDGRLERLFYNLNILNDEQLAQIPVENRDLITVLPTELNVYVLGAVTTAGAFPYSPTSTPLDYLAQAGGPVTDAHLRFAVIFRPPRDPSAPLEQGEAIPCDLVEPFLTGTAPAGVTMEPGDILFIPDRGEFLSFTEILSSIGVIVNAVRLF